MFQYGKMSLPHIGLTVLLFGYVMLGALMFVLIEGKQEDRYLDDRSIRSEILIAKIANETWSNGNVSKFDFDRQMEDLIKNYLNTNEPYVGRSNRPGITSEAMHLSRKRWTLRSAILYCTTVISSTGK